MTQEIHYRSMRLFAFAICLMLSITTASLYATNGPSTLTTFSELSELKNLTDQTFALQLGDAGGIWIKKSGQRSDNGGTIVGMDKSYHWARQCDPGRLDVRWFGVVADGQADDAAALQSAIDALPSSGGKVLLPSGTMRCSKSLVINRSFLTIEGTNCGLLSKHFEPQKTIGKGSLLFFDSTDGIIIQPPAKEAGKPKPARLGGITLREFGIAGSGKKDEQTGIIVKRGENRGWGTTDGLLLQRIYCIDLTWAVEFTEADMSVIDACWLSECGNGMRLKGCIYNIISNTCFADNDGTGIEMNGGRGTEISGSVFVRNKHGLKINNAQRIRIIGGVFETDVNGGARDDKDFIYSSGSHELIVQGASFSSTTNVIPAAVIFKGPEPLVEACTYSGKVTQLIAKE